MKKIAASVIIMLFAIAASAQETAPLTKQEKKALKQEQKRQTEVMLAKNTAEALKSGRFVLKADQMRGRGDRVDLNGVLVPWTGTGAQIYKGRETY